MPMILQTSTPTWERPDAPVRSRAAPYGSFRRILVPVDFSPATRAALKAARAWTTRSGGAIWLLHVIEPVSFLNGAEAVVLLRRETDLAAEAKTNLDRLAAQLRRPGLVVETFVRHGHATDVIRLMTEELAADLIVIGRHRHAWWERLISVSTAEKVLRHAPCPVLGLPDAGTADETWQSSGASSRLTGSGRENHRGPKAAR